MRDLLELERLTAVVDIGANPIDGDPPYKSLLQQGLCTLVGFEPQEGALARLNAAKGPNERYFPYVVGDGGVHAFNECAHSGLSSLLEPDETRLRLWGPLAQTGRVVRRIENVATHRLDDIEEIEVLDFLKIDIQGGELSVFANGRKKLSEAVAIQVEVSFSPLYKSQPSFGDIDVELRAQGFSFYRFLHTKTFAMNPRRPDYGNVLLSRQLIDGDALYFRDYGRPDAMTDAQLKHLAMIAYYVYQAPDVGRHCLSVLEERGALPEGSVQRSLALRG